MIVQCLLASVASWGQGALPRFGMPLFVGAVLGRQSQKPGRAGQRPHGESDRDGQSKS